jgi:pSer/pThr/pTyr-binding forkhead associated (FHA) protein
MSEVIQKEIKGVRLEIIEGPMKGLKYFVMKGKPVEIGRSSANDFPIPGDLRISRKHSRINIEKNGVCLLEDIGSKNGTFVRGKRITQKTELKLPGVFTIGESSIRVSQVFSEVSRETSPQEDNTRELRRKLDNLQRENAELRKKIIELHQKVNSPLQEKESSSRIFHALYRFGLGIERFVVALVHSLFTGVEASGELKLPFHSKNLKQLMNQFLTENYNTELEKSIERYLQDLNKWVIAVNAGYQYVVDNWFKSLWKEIGPQSIESSLKAGFFDRREEKLWNLYKERVRNLTPEYVEDQMTEMVAKIAKKYFDNLRKGKR